MDNSKLEFKNFASPGDFFAPDPAHPPPPDPARSSLSGNLLDVSSADSQQPQAAKPHFLSMSYYQRFFDIDDEQVFTRLLNSAIPRRRGNFIADFVQPNPDLWGPFWVCVTLVFAIAIVGNFERFLQFYALGVVDGTYTSADFSFVTGATSLVFGYVLVMPSLCYAFLWYQIRPLALHYSFFDLVCAFGYALSLFIPLSLLWLLLPFPAARWALVAGAVALTGSVLAISLWAAVKDDPNRLVAFGFLLGVFLAHALLALCLKEFFLDESIHPAIHPPRILPSQPTPLSPLNMSTAVPIPKASNNGTIGG